MLKTTHQAVVCSFTLLKFIHFWDFKEDPSTWRGSAYWGMKTMISLDLLFHEIHQLGTVLMSLG